MDQIEGNERFDDKLTNKAQDVTKSTKRGSTLLMYLHDLALLITIVLLLFSLFLRVVVVSGPSMNATLVDGDWLLVLGNAIYAEPKTGDIIVAQKDAFDDEPIIKRVIATEGQVVDIDFFSGVVYVDGQPLDETYTLTDTNLDEGMTFPLTVEDGCVFVLGDNRNKSKDSRSPEIGLIDCREILGKAFFLLLPGTNKGTEPRNLARIGVVS